MGLTEQQAENNVYRILLEMLAVVLSKNARARAVQLPAWNEALGLPRPWDQQWSLRMQQIVAYETDLLDYGDIFDGSQVIAAKVEELKAAARVELDKRPRHGRRHRRDRTGLYEDANWSTPTPRACAPSRPARRSSSASTPSLRASLRRLRSEDGKSVLTVSENVEYEQIERLESMARDARCKARCKPLCTDLERRRARRPQHHGALDRLRQGGRHHRRMGRDLAPSLRRISRADRRHLIMRGESPRNRSTMCAHAVAALAAQARHEARKFLVGKPGLDGHSNGAEQIAVRAAECGFEVTYDGIRLTPEQIVAAAREQGVHVVGLSILSGSHVPLVRETMKRLRAAGLGHVPVVVGGIVPAEDVLVLKQLGVAQDLYA